MMTQNNKTGFLDRALGNLRDAWRGIAGSAYDAAAATTTHPDLPEGHAERLREQMRACLETRGGEVSARAPGRRPLGMPTSPLTLLGASVS